LGRPGPDSVVSLGVRWATRVTTIGLEFALPPLLGGVLDRRWRLGSILTILGALFGFLTGMVHLLAIAREDARANPPKGKPGGKAAGGGGSDATQSGWSDDG
jgi:ATP synthase protein I